MNSATIQKMRDAGCVIFTVFPSKVTAVGVITAEGLVILDDMGGNRGLKYVSLGPLGPGIIIPKDPEKFAVNLGQTAINPFRQAKVCEKVLTDAVKAADVLYSVSKKYSHSPFLRPIFSTNC